MKSTLVGVADEREQSRKEKMNNDLNMAAAGNAPNYEIVHGCDLPP
jgi:hypothetical protein